MPSCTKMGLGTTGYATGTGNKSRNARKVRARRRVLEGFPWMGQFETREQVEKYLGGDNIQCLLCGRMLKRLGGAHLQRIHGITGDSYRKKYGLFWSRGLTSETAHQNYITASSARVPGFVQNKNWIRKDVGPFHPLPPFRKKELLAVRPNGQPEVYTTVDFEEFLRRAQTGRTFAEVATDLDMPKFTRWNVYCRDNPEFRRQAETVWDDLPFEVQARGHRLSKRFTNEVLRLRAEGLNDYETAEKLKVAVMSVNRHRNKSTSP